MSFEFHKVPDHLILDIFKKLHASDLPNIRLVCRKWAEIVSESIQLRRKQQLVVIEKLFNEYDEFIQTFIHSPYNIYTNIKFENVFIEDREIVTRLWCKIGANIECLSIELTEHYDVTADVNIYLCKRIWLALLKKTPNLIELDIKLTITEFNDSIYSDEIPNEFNLKKLEKVNLDSRDSFLNQYIMKILMKTANKLVALRFSLFSEMDFDTMYFLIESQRHSLKLLELGGDFTKKDWQKYLSINNLSLEVVKFNDKIILDNDLLELLGNHKNLRELTSHVDASEDYKQYPAYLSKLEKLELTIELYTGDVNYSFPKNLNNLKSLKIRTNFHEDISIITFETPSSCPTLQVLKINSDSPVEISPISLQSFIDNYPNLKVLKLRNYICYPQSVAAIANKLLLLEELELRVFVLNFKIGKIHPFPKKLDNLKSLKMHMELYQNERNFTLSFEIPTFRPMLEVLEINNDERMRMSPISIQSFVDNFPNLRVLKLSDFYCNSRSVAAISEKLVHLEHLELHIRVTKSNIEKNAFSTISNLGKLKHLSVFGFIHICDDSFFIEHLRLPALTFLAMHSKSHVKNVTDRGIFGLIENCPMLERIFFSKFKKVTEIGLHAFFERLVHLKGIGMDGSENFYNEMF